MAATQLDPSNPGTYPTGQRLACEQCGAEVEIISPCTCEPPDQVLSCCGKPMTPTTGRSINLGVE